MAAGIVYHNLTTAEGVSFTVASWVPDTTAPNVGAIPVHLVVDGTGAPVGPATQTTAAAILAKIIAAPATEAKQDTIVTALGLLHTDLATTIAAYVDGLEALIGTTNSGNASILAKLIAAPATEAKQDSIITALATTPAGTNLIGKIAAGLATDAIYSGATALTPKFVKVAAASSGNNTLVAAVTSKKIRVLAYNFMGAAAVNAKFQDGAGGTDLTGLKYLDAAGAGICAPFNPVGWFETTANTLLNLNLSGAVAVGGELVYVEV